MNIATHYNLAKGYTKFSGSLLLQLLVHLSVFSNDTGTSTGKKISNIFIVYLSSIPPSVMRLFAYTISNYCQSLSCHICYNKDAHPSPTFESSFQIYFYVSPICIRSLAKKLVNQYLYLSYKILVYSSLEFFHLLYCF